MNVEMKILKELKSTEFTLISGLPGIAYIGKLSVDYLIQQLKAELVGEVYSRFFPPYVLIKADGVVELMKNELYRLEDGARGDIMSSQGTHKHFRQRGNTK